MPTSVKFAVTVIGLPAGGGVVGPFALLITGATGTLGKAFARVCEQRGLSYYLLTRQELDIAELESVNAAPSCAVLISEVAPALLSTPSKTLGKSRPPGAGWDSTLVKAAPAVINLIPRTNKILAC